MTCPVCGAVDPMEINARWVVYRDDEKIGEGTTVAAPRVLNGMVGYFARRGQRFMWERR